ncbi:hypothetical protein SAMN05877842_1261, partial [Ureibacillus acetophenoni]
GVIISNPDTFVSIGNLSSPTTLLAIIGLVITIVMLVRGINEGQRDRYNVLTSE